MNRYTVRALHNFYSREVSVSCCRPPTTPVSRQNRRDTSFPGMSLDSLLNVGMGIDNDIKSYISSNNSGQH